MLSDIQIKVYTSIFGAETRGVRIQLELVQFQDFKIHNFYKNENNTGLVFQ